MRPQAVRGLVGRNGSDHPSGESKYGRLSRPFGSGARRRVCSSDRSGEPGVWGRDNSRLDADLLTPTEIELLMKQCSRRAPTGVRNRALVAVLWRCGLRIGEARGLAVKDFDPDSGTLVVQRGKGGRRRVVGVDSGTVALIGRWLEVRRKLDLPAAAPRSSARSRGSPSTSRTSRTCCRGSRARRVSSGACTPTGSATLSR